MKKLMDLVKELSFVRIGGSQEEKQAAKLIQEEINQAAREAGREYIRGEYMTFRIPDAKVTKCSVQAAGREIPCVPFLQSGCIDRECTLVYLDDASEIDFAGVGSLEGKVVLLNNLTDEKCYKRLVEHKAWASIISPKRRLLCIPGDCGSISPETGVFPALRFRRRMRCG